MTRLAFFMPSLAGGGAERVTLDLCAGLAEQGHDVQLWLGRAEGPLVDDAAAMRERVSTVDLTRARTVSTLVPLVRMLRRERPEVVVGVLAHASVVLVLAHLVARSRARLVVMQHNTMSVSTGRSERRRDRLLPLACGTAFRRADVICAVSEGVADDLAATAGLDRSRVHVSPNPIDYARIAKLGAEPVPPSLAAAPGERLVVAAGRLVEQKGFGTLLDAFAGLGPQWRLVVLGEGPERARLERRAAELGVADRVRLPGFTANPYPLFRSADVFALSSRWEGLPTVLLELLAFPTPIVATDCPSGPREILEGGSHGTLVPVGDARALREAIEQAVRSPAGPREAVRARYDRARVVRRFHELVAGAGGSR